MTPDDERPRLAGAGTLLGGQQPGPFATVVALAVGGLVLVGVFMLSLVLFTALLAVGAVIGAYLWWKTRDLRKQMREMREAEGIVIEGQAVREKDAGNIYDQ